MNSRLQAYLKDEPLLRPAQVSLKPQRTPHLALVSIDGIRRDRLTQKEEEVCNRATD